jgi:hypothetical protein
MSRVVGRLAIVAVLVTSVLIPATALAFPLTTCTATITSYAADGTQLDQVVSGADDATRTEPFNVDWDGQIAWEGTTGGIVFTNFTYGISVTGIPTPLSGAVVNSSGATEGSGTVVPSDVLPINLVGLFFVTGKATAEDGSTCEGSGWVKFDGSPFGSMQFWIGLALLALGILLIVLGRGGRWLLGLIGGILAGLGSAILLITFSLMLLAEWTPPVALVAGVLIGLAVTIPKGSAKPDQPDQPATSPAPPPAASPPAAPPPADIGSAGTGDTPAGA